MTRGFNALRCVADVYDGSERLGCGPNGLDCPKPDEIDSRTAESPAGQPGTETPWDVSNRSSEGVDPGRDDLEVISHAAMRVVHQFTQGGEIVCAECLGCGDGSVVLGDNVASSPAQR